MLQRQKKSVILQRTKVPESIMRPSQKQITPEQLAFAQAHALVRIVDDEADLREALSFVLDMEG